MSRLLLMVNYVFSLGLVLAYLASYVNPEQFVYIAFFGLAYPIFLLANVLFLLLWLIMRKRYLILPLLLIVLGWNHFQRHYQFRGEHLENSSLHQIKVLSYNVKNLSNSNYGIENKLLRESIFQFLEKERPGILCLQEFLIPARDSSRVLNYLKQEINLPSVYFGNYRLETKEIDGLILFTKYPVLNKGSVVIEDEHIFAIFTDLIIVDDTFRVYNTHYESIRFRHEDYQFVSELTENGKSEQKFSEGSLNILNKLASAFRKRSLQVEILEEHMKSSPYPIILCGDFNDTPSSYVYRTTTGELKDAFMESGSGYNNTYAGQLPPIRIDYILCDPALDVYDYKTHYDFQQSDHYPISCIITRSQ